MPLPFSTFWEHETLENDLSHYFYKKKRDKKMGYSKKMGE